MTAQPCLSDLPCPACGQSGLDVFYKQKALPVHSVLIHATKAEATQIPRGDLSLAFCERCGFISNLAYDPDFQAYDEEYESTQGFSPTFSAFSQHLAEHLVARYNLQHKKIVEIGCGLGEFLTLLCELGENRGLGYDPAYRPSNLRTQADVKFIPDYYTEKNAPEEMDFLVCKMTLEHIYNPGEFLALVRRTLDGNPDVVVFFQVPDVTRILREAAFWDIYYEHISYFSPSSLGYIFQRHGFSVLDLWRDYDDQYLLLIATPAAKRLSGPGQSHLAFPRIKKHLLDLAEGANALVAAKSYFEAIIPDNLQTWKSFLARNFQEGKKVVLWGAGSKAVAFLTTLRVGEEISFCVDINPRKHGTFLAGTGHPVRPPRALKTEKPAVVIIMNPIYRQEIQRDMDEMGVSSNIITVNDVPKT